MDLFLLMGVYFGFISVIFASLLLGEQPRFQGTPLSFTRWLMTKGACNLFGQVEPTPHLACAFSAA